MEKFEQEGVSNIDKVRKFCENFDGGEILQLPDCQINVVRKDAHDKIIAVYKFGKDGELMEYQDLGELPETEDVLKELKLDDKSSIKVIPLESKKREKTLNK